MNLTAESCNRVSPALAIILARVPGLPPAMHVLPKLLTALGDTDTDISHVAELVAFDPGLTVRLIHLCNSAAMGGEIRVSDVGQAVNRLGVNCVFQLVAALTGNSVLKSPAVLKVLDVDQLWEHSVMVALAAAILAKDLNEDDSASFTAGLLHELGKIVIAQTFRELYTRMLVQYADAPEQLVNQERAVFTFDFPEAGGHMLAREDFPDAIVASITFQYRPEAASKHTRAAALLNVANTLAGWTGTSPGDAMLARPAQLEALQILELAPRQLPAYCERIAEEFEFANSLCQL